MIDPSNITNFNLTDDQLEEHILFWVCAAGKNGHTAAKSLEKLRLRLEAYSDKLPGEEFSIFAAIRRRAKLNLMGMLVKDINFPEMLRSCGIGAYNMKAFTMESLAHADLNLRTCSTRDLENIKGIGRKSSRCFIMHTREGARCAGLDTHILKYLRYRGVPGVPEATPPGKAEYLRLETEFLKFADQAGKSAAHFDLEIWNTYAVKPKGRK